MSDTDEQRRRAKNEGMEASGTLFSGIGSILSGIGGLIGGAVAVIGIISAKPDLVTVIIPVQTLERVVERAQAEAAAPAPAAPQAAPQPVVAAAPAPVAPVQSLQGDLSAALISLANTPDVFVANVRITNNSAAGVLISGRVADIAAGDFSVSDSLGGSCPWSNRGRAQLPLGSLKLATGQTSGTQLLYTENYTPVGPGQSVAVTLLFHKVMCATPISGTQPTTVSGTFVIVENDVVRFASASFEGVAPAQAN